MQAELEQALASLPNPPDPSAADEDTTLREVGEAGATGRDHLELAGDADRHGGGRADRRARASRCSRATWCCSSWRSCGGRSSCWPSTASSRWSRRCWCARRRCSAPASCPTPSSRSTGWPTTRLYLAGTSEVALASLHAGEMLDEAALPLRYAGFSPCFRREAGAAGRDTRGMFRVHQFDKVEMFSFVPRRGRRRTSTSGCWRSRRRSCRRSRSRTAWSTSRSTTSARSAAKKYDCEAWLPGQQRYREVTSTSNTTDFQARRLDVRYRPGGGQAAPRPHAQRHRGHLAHMIAILENGQQEDGSVRSRPCCASGVRRRRCG